MTGRSSADAAMGCSSYHDQRGPWQELAAEPADRSSGHAGTERIGRNTAQPRKHGPWDEKRRCVAPAVRSDAPLGHTSRKTRAAENPGELSKKLFEGRVVETRCVRHRLLARRVVDVRK